MSADLQPRGRFSRKNRELNEEFAFSLPCTSRGPASWHIETPGSPPDRSPLSVNSLRGTASRSAHPAPENRRGSHIQDHDLRLDLGRGQVGSIARPLASARDSERPEAPSLAGRCAGFRRRSDRITSASTPGRRSRRACEDSQSSANTSEVDECCACGYESDPRNRNSDRRLPLAGPGCAVERSTKNQ